MKIEYYNAGFGDKDPGLPAFVLSSAEVGGSLPDQPHERERSVLSE